MPPQACDQACRQIRVSAFTLPELVHSRTIDQFVHQASCCALHRPMCAHALCYSQPPAPAPSSGACSRCLRAWLQVHNEMRIHAAAAHPSICPLFGAFAEPDGTTVLVLRYAALGSVAEHLLQLDNAVAEPYAVARLVRPLLTAVEFLHAHSVVHRDIKIENVLMDGDSGNAVLADFGVAADVSEQSPSSRPGTLPYMVRPPPASLCGTVEERRETPAESAGGGAARCRARMRALQLAWAAWQPSASLHRSSWVHGAISSASVATTSADASRHAGARGAAGAGSRRAVRRATPAGVDPHATPPPCDPLRCGTHRARALTAARFRRRRAVVCAQAHARITACPCRKRCRAAACVRCCSAGAAA